MWKPPARVLVPVVLLVATALPSAGELIVFSGGHVLKVAGFEVDEETVALRFPAGGGMRVSLRSIERIVDDEVLPEPERNQGLEQAGGTVRIGFEEGQPIPATPYGEQIFAAARRESLNPAVVAALIRAESAFDAGAVSIKGARGLMQLMPATARRFGVASSDLFSPERNLEAGTRYLSWLSERFPGDLPRILAAYNAGEANVDRYGGVPPFRETRGYIKRIYGTLGLDPTFALAR